MRARPALVNPRLRSGVIAVQVALSLTAIVGMLAIAVDGGNLLAVRRMAQATADAAALAAASDLYLGHSTSAAKTSAQDIGVSNGFTRANVVVNIPPLSGSFTSGTPGASPSDAGSYAEAIVTYNQGRYFSSIFGTGTIAVSGRAVAKGEASAAGNPGILLLSPNANVALGASRIWFSRLTGGSVVVNSNSSSAVGLSGSAHLTAQPSFLSRAVT